MVVTASHNPIQVHSYTYRGGERNDLIFFLFLKDNGVKLIDPMGEMLTMEWESYARDLANTT